MLTRVSRLPLRQLGATAIALTALLLANPGCARREALVGVVGRGVVNDPRNKSLRFDLLKFGLDQLCRVMTRQGIPLRMRDDEPVSGRFFADTCGSQVIDEQDRQSLVLQYSGRGYAWTAVTGRVGFTSAGIVEYAPDFQLHAGAMYVYFRPRGVTAANVQTLLIESGAATTTMTTLGVDANRAGGAILRGQLERGFTVIRIGAEGESRFGPGYIPRGELPTTPFTVERSRHLTLVNDATEVHPGQQDYVGGFEIERRGQALHLTASLEGTPAVDLLVVPKGYGDQMVGRYVSSPGPAAPGAPPVFEDVLVAGQPYRRTIPLPPGLYYLVLDNSAEIGRTVSDGSGARAAKIDYLVQIGKAR